MGYYKRFAGQTRRRETSHATGSSVGVAFRVDSRKVMEALGNVQIKEVVKKKDLNKVIRSELSVVRKKVVSAASSAMMSDPRRARNAVKATLYKRVIGGSVSLLNQKKASKNGNKYEKKRGGVSGIIRNKYKSERTKQIEKYAGRDRGFILRFVNQGTVTRTANGRGGRGNRGAITGKNFFEPVANAGMRMAAENMRKQVDKMIEDVWKETK